VAVNVAVTNGSFLIIDVDVVRLAVLVATALIVLAVLYKDRRDRRGPSR
jgi:hypothetical protein